MKLIPKLGMSFLIIINKNEKKIRKMKKKIKIIWKIKKKFVFLQ